MVSIGYITNPDNPSGSFVSIGIVASDPSSSWTGFQRVGFHNLQAFNNYSNVRLALKFQGTWMLNWAHLYEHFVLLPATSQALNTLMLDIDVRPNGSSNRTLQIGYVTNPNDQTTFTALQTIDATYYWSHYNSVRVDYAGAPANAARLALVYSGGSWDYQNVSVSVSSPMEVPYTAVLPTTEQPEGWMANNYYYSNDSGGYAYLSFGCAVLPQFTTPIGVLQLDIDISPTGSENRTMRIGYLTNPNDLTTFTALQTFTAYSNWHYYLTKRVSFYGAPSGARIAIVCEDSWKIQNVNVHQPTPISVPYTAVLPTTGQPEGWIANNYNYTNYYGEYAYLSSGYAVLPKFTTPIPPLQLEIDISPTGSENRTMQIGYLTNPNDQSTFVALQTISAYSSWNSYRTKRVSFYGAPADARIAIVCDNTWKIQNVNVRIPSISIPYTQDFEDLDVGSLPDGWYAPNMSVKGTYNSVAPHGGTKQLVGEGYIMLPVLGRFFVKGKTLTQIANEITAQVSKNVKDPALLKEMRYMLSEYQYKVIHFNHGLHGLRIKEEEYEGYLRAYVTEVKKLAGDAKLVWGRITPLRGGMDRKENAFLERRNKVADKVMADFGIEIDDLWGVVWSQNNSDDIRSDNKGDSYHYNAKGNELLGKAVADAIRKAGGFAPKE